MRSKTLPRMFRLIAACVTLLLANAAMAVAQTQLGAITGTVTANGGTPIAGARVTVAGPMRGTTVTADNGTFSVSVSPGLYRVSVDRGGYQTVSVTDVAVAPGGSQLVTVTMNETSLESLQTIGSVTTTAAGSVAINNGPANQSSLTADAFRQSASPQVNDVLQRLPDIVVQHMGTQADTTIVVGGLQPYETQVLIDGHPIALGQYGVWVSQYFPSFLVGGAETETGPGNTTPFANIAVGGTVNITTPGFTAKPTAAVTSGTDSYGSLYDNVLVTGKTGPVSYVAGLGQSWTNGRYTNQTGCDVYYSDPATAPNTAGFAGIVPFCGTIGDSFWTRGMVYKLKFDFSTSTSLEASFVGSYAGYSPASVADGATSYGPTLVEKCIPGTLECTSPFDQNLVGQTINGIYWYPGGINTAQQQMFSAQFRTSIGHDTLIIRPYIANLYPETVDGTLQGSYAAFYGPGASYPACTSLTPTATCYPGPPSLAPGVKIPGTGLPNPNAFENSTCPPGSIYSYTQINSPANTITSAGGQETCYQYPFSTGEFDKSYGNTLTYIHPFGDNYLQFTYDFHGQETFAYDNAPSNYTVPPGSATRFSTFSLTTGLHPTQSLSVYAGLYNTVWSASGQQPLVDPSSGAITEIGLQRSVARFDPHIALVFRPTTKTSYRAAYGTSETFPFIGDVSGPASFIPPYYPYTAGVVSQKNPNLQPEQSLAYSLGVDHRFKNGAVLSLDAVRTNVHNVFQQITTTEDVIYNGSPAILGVFSPINVARLQADVLTAKYAFAPAQGFGYNVALSADRSILHGIPAIAYNDNPALPANDVQVCGSAAVTPGLATCIPYLKGYGQFTYAWHGGTFAALGVDYEGKNNAYYQPPMAIADLTVRQPLGKQVDLQLSIQNLFNTNAYTGLPAANAGVPVTGNTSADGVTIQQGSYSTFLLPAVSRAARLQVRFHTGS
jgi:outer membrane receptor protein involved in Fe transport